MARGTATPALIFRIAISVKTVVSVRDVRTVLVVGIVVLAPTALAVSD